MLFLFWYYVQHKYKSALLNPLLFTVISIVGGLWVYGVSYQDFHQSTEYISSMLEPAVVLLGYPLYKQLHLLRVQWRHILFICAVSSMFALTVITLMAKLLGLEEWLIASMVTMNITTAVAMSTSIELNGVGSIAAVMVLMAGLTGSLFGVTWLRLLSIVKLPPQHHFMGFSYSAEQKTIGMAVGSASHALGTASIAKSFPIAAAYSSTALILCAIISAIVAPVYVPFLMGL